VNVAEFCDGTPVPNCMAEDFEENISALEGRDNNGVEKTT
jgi:hypothetical protein